MANAAQTAINEGTTVNQDNFLKYTQLGKTEIDIFIRTGGDMRLSNFLLPNIGYSELFFTEKLWPEFGSVDFIEILEEFKNRQRRFGK
jgi:undecaprenyl diphosphate synthase